MGGKNRKVLSENQDSQEEKEGLSPEDARPAFPTSCRMWPHPQMLGMKRKTMVYQLPEAASHFPYRKETSIHKGKNAVQPPKLLALLQQRPPSCRACFIYNSSILYFHN